MGKQLEKLIVILGIILIGTAVFAEQTVKDVPSNNPVLVTREKKKEEIKQPTKELQSKKTPPCCKKQNKTKTAKKAKPSKPQYLGLKIYEIEKPKPKVAKVKKLRCIDDPKSICNERRLKPAKPYLIPKAPRYSRTYDDKYRKSGLPDFPPLKPAEPIKIISCY